MNNTTVMSLLGGRETFLQYSTHKEVMKWASMRMYVDLQVSADEMQPCRAVHNFTQQCGSLLRCVRPSLGSILITSILP